MAKVTVTCSNPQCGAKFQTEQEHVGKTARCPKCGRDFVLQAPQGPAPPGEAPPAPITAIARQTTDAGPPPAGEPARQPPPFTAPPPLPGQAFVKRNLGYSLELPAATWQIVEDGALTFRLRDAQTGDAIAIDVSYDAAGAVDRKSLTDAEPDHGFIVHNESTAEIDGSDACVLELMFPARGTRVVGGCVRQGGQLVKITSDSAERPRALENFEQVRRSLTFDPQVLTQRSLRAPIAPPVPIPAGGPGPAPGVYCPYCRMQVAPVMLQRVSAAGWVVFALLLFFCVPLCWIGVLMKESYTACGQCGRPLR